MQIMPGHQQVFKDGNKCRGLKVLQRTLSFLARAESSVNFWPLSRNSFFPKDSHLDWEKLDRGDGHYRCEDVTLHSYS